ncbi:Leucine-rich repeat-containing protein 15, partial [Pseudolycoriella hygida]
MRAKQHRLRNQSWFFCVTLLCCLQTNRAGRSLSLCGNVDIIQNVIQSGNEATRGQWPFAVALYNLIDSQNFCGGSLISRKHVLTAAHCVQPKYVDDILSPLDLVAILGAHNITNLDQDGVVRANVAQIYVNPDWDPYTSSFDADVAVLNVIQSGNEATRGQWPFAVVLYNLRDSQHFCGGSLISRKHVLTAAHCVQAKYSEDILSPLDLVAILGAHNITNFDQDGVVRANVAQIYVNPDWDPYSSSFDADIAVLVLNEIVQFTNYIRPICMPTDSADINSATISVNGTIVGWGLTDNATSVEILRYASIEALNEYSCYKANEAMEIYTSNRTFCGRFGNGIPDYGDSGGGFFVVSNYAWVQYGIISVMGTDSFGRISADSVSLYTNVKAFKNWIVETVVESDSRVAEPIIQVNFTPVCTHFVDVLGCVFDNLNIEKENVLPARVDASLPHGNNYTDVKLLHFQSGSIVSIPIGIGSFFPNLKAIQVVESASLKIVMKQSFLLMNNLEELKFSSPKISLVDDDSLSYLPNLKLFILVNAQVRTLGEKLFEKNDKLENVFLESNQLLQNLPGKLFHKNPQLELISFRNNSLKHIDENTFAFNDILREVSLSSNKLSHLPENLFKNNLQLEKLDVSQNLLQTLDESIFEFNGKLRQILLSSNRLELIPRRIFERNFELEALDLSENSLKKIDEKTFATNTKLRQLDLSSNNLESLPGKLFENNSLLEIINLNKNFLKTIDERTFVTNSQLQVVMLFSNNLELLPTNLFRNNSLLVQIFLSENSLTSINEQLFQENSKLEVVDLHANKLEVLPKSVFEYNFFLQFLALDNNSLKAVDEDLFQTNFFLKEIYLSVNQLESLPMNLFRNNLSLEWISLAHNFLQTIGETLFARNNNLRLVDLSSNVLKSFSVNLFKNNFQLDVISVKNNSIKMIEEETFKANAKLRHVDLAFNELEVLPRNLFQNNLLMQNIDFEGNSLKRIETDFTKLSDVKEISFYNNTCINAKYDSSDSSPNDFHDLTEFQNLLRSSCTPA